MSAHTFGSWHVGMGNGAGSIFSDNGRMRWEPDGTTLYPIAQVNRGWNEAEDEANARLIAAAPDLLIALEACLHRLDAHDEQSAPECLAARAAIERATGRPV